MPVEDPPSGPGEPTEKGVARVMTDGNTESNIETEEDPLMRMNEAVEMVEESPPEFGSLFGDPGDYAK